MESSKATVNVYDYSQKNKKKGPISIIGKIILKLIQFVITICVLGLAGYSVYMFFFNQEALTEIDHMAKYSVQNIYNYIGTNGVDNYKVIYFPDNENIVGYNGKINNDLGLDLNQFEAGYIIMYSNGSYAYELSYNKYCIVKGVNDNKYSVHIFKKCETDKMDDLKG